MFGGWDEPAYKVLLVWTAVRQTRTDASEFANVWRRVVVAVGTSVSQTIQLALARLVALLAALAVRLSFEFSRVAARPRLEAVCPASPVRLSPLATKQTAPLLTPCSVSVPKPP